MDNRVKSEDRLHKVIFIITAVTIIIVAVMLILVTKNDVSRPLRIGGIFNGKTTDSDWNSVNYDCISSACKEYGARFEFIEDVPVEKEACDQAIGKLASSGCSIIFLTGYGYSDLITGFERKYRNIQFLTSGSDMPNKNLKYFSARVYEARYLAGIIAGLTTKTNILGYIAPMESNDINRGINAFALGARYVNPDAKISVHFTGSWTDKEKAEQAVYSLRECNADVITYQLSDGTVADLCEQIGIDYIAPGILEGERSDHYLTSIECSWEMIFENIIRDSIGKRTDNNRSYWLGIKDKAVRLTSYSDRVPMRARYEITYAIRKMELRESVFADEIYDNKGVLRCEKGELMSDKALLYDMDWLAEGVEIDEA
ncbi:MAG: BMP family ABC transporter substrate-binding protein [Ruminiclostridium sp.]|nr:BMP family ABC transporter substrate-binding protein [Ruminiclostridium sp.]